MDEDKLFIFRLSVHAIVGFNVVRGVEGVGWVENVLFPECLHLIKYNYYIGSYCYI